MHSWNSLGAVLFVFAVANSINAPIIVTTGSYDCSINNCINQLVICTNDQSTCTISCSNTNNCLNTTIYTSSITTTIDCTNQEACNNMKIYCGDLSLIHPQLSFPEIIWNYNCKFYT